MTAESGKKAPYQEWVLMYRGGLTRGRIAELVGAAPKTVGYHLAIARAGDPELQAAHEAAAALKTAHAATPQGLQRMQQLVAMVQETGRRKQIGSIQRPRPTHAVPGVLWAMGLRYDDPRLAEPTLLRIAAEESSAAARPRSGEPDLGNPCRTPYRPGMYPGTQRRSPIHQVKSWETNRSLLGN